jgi:thioredoxin 1
MNNRLLKKVLFLCIPLFYFSCNNMRQDPVAAVQSGPLDVAGFEKQIQANQPAQLLDVRTPEEYNQGHLKNAKNINWNGNDFESEALKLDKTKPVLVYCLSGGRSKEAADYLKGKEFKTVYELDGGILQWAKEGKEIVTDSDVKGKNGAEQKNENLSEDEFRNLVSKDQLVLVDFNAPWCKPCRLLSPVLEEVEQEMSGKLKVLKIDVDQNRDLASSLAVANIPAIFVYKEGKLVWQQVGLIEKAQLTAVLGKL